MSDASYGFTLLRTEGRARRGRFVTPHGTIETPVFMNVGTSAAIRGGVSTADLREIGCQVELSNTYHLHIRPGDDLIRRLGGIHKFFNWDRPVLTDSGGFQVFSLAKLRKITEEGVSFNSHIDGKRIFMGPEESMRIQSNLASTIAMAFDECVENPAEYGYAKKSCERTYRWLLRSRAELDRLNGLPDTINREQMLFGINQGCTYPDLRVDHMKRISEVPCDGYAIGGLAVGETAGEMYEIIEAVEPFAPKDKPRYLMGVGTPVNILEAVYRGVDFFDCVMPSRNARHGNLFTWEGKLTILNEAFREDPRPISESCGCPACRDYSRAYIRHLLKVNEMLGMRLCVLHNLYFYNELMRKIRDALDEGRFEEFYKKYVVLLGQRCGGESAAADKKKRGKKRQMCDDTLKRELEDVVSRFPEIEGMRFFEPYGSGHINKTFLVVSETGKKYIVQRVNTSVFKNTAGLMSNISEVTKHIREKAISAGQDPDRATMAILPTDDGRSFVENESGVWRAMRFIKSESHDRAERPELAGALGRAVGRFQKWVADLDPSKLVETIPDFHDTGKRYEAFEKAVSEDIAGRAKDVKPEIAFVRARKDETTKLTSLIKTGELPLRITHNDTKLNNVLFDTETGEPLCMIDLDTVMPGLVHYDFGDAVRFCAATADEDERDLTKMHFSMENYRAFAEGFLEECGGDLTEKEISLLPFSCRLLTLECGMRFLTDYLNGDTYFSVSREGQNLDRCRTQFRLVKEMEERFDEMQTAVNRNG